MNPIVLAALALLESNPQPFIEPYPIKRRYVREQTPNPDRQAAAQAKRERKAAKRLEQRKEGV